MSTFCFYRIFVDFCIARLAWLDVGLSLTSFGLADWLIDRLTDFVTFLSQSVQPAVKAADVAADSVTWNEV